MPWNWDGKPTVILSRAIDETNYVQPTLAELIAVRGDNSFTTIMLFGLGKSAAMGR
jgi:sulfane dehydrogenase subunit SoxC